MLQEIYDLPAGIIGIEAKGKVTHEDYEKVFRPILEKAHHDNRRVRFLYRIGSKFDKFTPGAVCTDLHLGLKYLRLFERCAVVTDRRWIRNACLLMAPLIPCTFEVFRETELDSAIEWLATPGQARNLVPRFLPKLGVLVVEVSGPLRRENFESLAHEVDPWIEMHQFLQGLVIHVKRFPGWENVGAFFRHLEFVGAHHRTIRRVAYVSDGAFPEVLPQMASHFVAAEIKHFGYGDLEKAISWAAAGEMDKAAVWQSAHSP